MKIRDIITETSAGGMAVVVAPLGKGRMIKRPNPSVYSAKKTATNEAPLPSDWDASTYSDKTSFSQRLKYALDRAKKIGQGSSRVAVEIEYQNRPTILKIAKNKKGMAQNQREADVLDDGVLSQLDILIPLIDYDTKNDSPTWLHTEKADKASAKQLCTAMKCDSLGQLTSLTKVLMGLTRGVTYSSATDQLKHAGKSEADIDTLTEYVSALADLHSAGVNLGDLERPSNWGMYKDKPVIIDAGLDQEVLDTHYRR